MNMKTIYRHFAAAVALVAAVSCTKQEEMPSQEGNGQAGTYEYILDATQEGITRTTMDGLSILWSKDDQIGIGGITSDNKFAGALASGGAQSITDSENYTPSVSAAFRLVLPEGFNPKVAGYPYNDNISYTKGNATDNVDACSVEIPAIQVGIKDNLPAKAFAMVGKIDKETGKCPMHNVGAVIKFEITGSDVASLRFEGNNGEVISGMRYYYTHNGNGKLAGNVIASKDADMAVATSVTLIPSDDVFEPGVYYFVVGQNTLANGFTMTLTNSRGLQAVRKTEGEFTIERNHKYVKFGSDEGWFSNVSTGVAGNLGTADGTTATLYGIAPATATDADILGFQTSTDGINWADYTGTIERRFATVPVTNVFTGNVTGLVPEEVSYYRAAYTNSIGVTTYGKAKEFRTYSNAHSAIIDLYNGADQWPFTNIEHGTDIKIGTSTDAVSEGEEFTLTNSNSESFVVKAKGGVWINKNTGCLTMQVYQGDYIKLPVIDDKKLVSVTMLVGGVEREGGNILFNQQGRPSVRKITSEGVFETSDVNGGDAWIPQSMYLYDSRSWSLNGTDAGTYGIYFNRADTRNCYISYLEVVYVDVKPAIINENLVWWTGHGNHSDNSNPEKDFPTKWPFAQGRSNWDSNKDFEFSTSDYEFIKYSFKSKLTLNFSRAGFQYGTEIGDYMAIKPSENYKLTSIKLRGGNSANNYSVTDMTGNVISGGEAKDMAAAYDSTLEFNLSGTTANTEYRLQVNTTTKTTIREMWITYELVK